MSTVEYRLRKEFTRVQVAVQELEDDVVIAGSDVYKTAELSVQKALDSHPAVERVPAKEKGGEKP